MTFPCQFLFLVCADILFVFFRYKNHLRLTIFFQSVHIFYLICPLIFSSQAVGVSLCFCYVSELSHYVSASFHWHITGVSFMFQMRWKCIPNAYNYVSFLSHMLHICLSFVSKYVVYMHFKSFFEQKHALLHSQRRLIICKIRILSDRIHFLSRAPPLIPR